MAQYQYRYISADPGAGKTDWAIRRAKKYLLVNPVLFVVPTRNLCDEIEQRSGGQIQAVHSGRFPGETIGPKIQDMMSVVARTHHNIALVITDAAYSHLHLRHDNWVVFKDEPKEPLAITELNLTDSHAWVMDSMFEFKIHEANDSFYRLRVRHPTAIKMTSELDDVTGRLFELAEYLRQDSYYEVLVDRDRWDQSRTLRYSVFQLPAAWADWGEVVFMGANFEDSLIYNQWRHLGVEWVPEAEHLPSMPTDRMNIHYLFDDMAWSARSRNAQRQEHTNLEWYLMWIRSEMPGGNYVYVANNGYEDEDLDLNGERMPAECHGLNRWRHVNNCVLLGSYLQSDVDELFYQYYKTSTSDIRGMRNAQYYVQQLTRTNIREYGSDLPINVYVPTRKEALDLLRYFRNARLHTPNGGIYRLRLDWHEPRVLSDQAPEFTGLTIGPNTFKNAVLMGEDGEAIQPETQVFNH